MSGKGLLVDSVILIDHFNGHEVASAYLAAHQSALNLTPITRAEVLTGFDVAGATLARALMDRIPLVALGSEHADLAAALRREHRWRLPDAFQAAAALLAGLTLVTRNERDFHPERFDFVEVPYRL